MVGKDARGGTLHWDAGRVRGPVTLTPAEHAVLIVYARGGTMGAAASLSPSPRTVRGHLARIRRKLGATNTTQALVTTIRTGDATLDELAAPLEPQWSRR